MIAALAPINARFVELRGDPAYLGRVLGDGAERANAIAAPVLAQVKDVVGFLR